MKTAQFLLLSLQIFNVEWGIRGGGVTSESDAVTHIHMMLGGYQIPPVGSRLTLRWH